MSKKPSKDVVEELNMILNELIEYVRKQGTLPNPKQDPDFYARLINFMDIAKEEGLSYTWADIAEKLGVGAALLRKRLSEYRKLEKEEVSVKPKPIENQKKEEVHEEVPVEIETTEEERREEKKEVKEEKTEEPATKRTETRILEAAKRHLGKKAEQLTKEEVDKLIRIGKNIVERYEKLCYAEGYSTLDECVDNAFSALFDLTKEYDNLRRKYDILLTLVDMLIDMAEPTLSRLIIIEEASKKLTPEDRDLLLDIVEGMIFE